MKKLLIFSLFITHYSIIYCQSVGIGTTTPNASAQLELKSTTKGFLMPQMTTAQRNAIVNPATGLEIFNLDSHCTNFFDGVKWNSDNAIKDAGSVTLPSWTQKASFGSQINKGVGFSIGTKGYIGVGINGGDFTYNFWEYSPENDSWTQKADFAGMPRYDAVGFSIGSKGYVGTGSFNGTSLADFWEYDPNNNSWTQKADFKGFPRSRAIAFSIDKMGYMGIGISKDANNVYTYFNDFWQYNPLSDKWTKKADFSFGTDAATGLSIGNKGYINGGDYFSSFWEYDPVNDTWTRKANSIAALGPYAIAFSIGKKGYFGSSINSKTFCEYNPDSNTWKQLEDFSGTIRENGIGFSIGDKGYIGFGIKDNNFWEYDPFTTVPSYISTSANLPTAAFIDEGIWARLGNKIYNKANTLVGIGISSPNYTLDVSGTAHCTSGAWSSDARFKNNINSISFGLKEIMQLHPVSYLWNRDKLKDDGMQGMQLGFLAQEVEKVLPNTVLTEKDEMQSKSIKYNELIPILTKALQEQQKQIEVLQKLVNTLIKK